MSDNPAETATNTTETVTPKSETGEGTQQPGNDQSLRTLETAEQRIKALNAENLKLRKQFEAAEKAKAEADAATAAEQGRYQELYEAEKAKAAEAQARLRQIEFDNLRKEQAAAAGIAQLWERLRGETAEELAEDAKTLAAFVAPPAPPATNGQPARAGTTPTPQAQGRHGLTDEERRARATRTF